jgi:tetratricopeptide (TPR) repeat protein
MTDEVEAVLKRRYLSHHEPLAVAREWTRRGGTEARNAVELLQELWRKYPYVLAVGNELVFALLQTGRREDAMNLLTRLEPRFQVIDEDTLSRWGRIFKDDGDKELQKASRDLDLADGHYRKAIERYDRAYQVGRGFYSGINKAALLMLCASLNRELTWAADQAGDAKKTLGYARQAEEDYQSARALAKELYDNRQHWQTRLPDDNIWLPATAGEAALLLERWEESAERYRDALRQANVQPFHPQSMRKQVERILGAFQKLGAAPQGPFTDLDSLFPPSPRA